MMEGVGVEECLVVIEGAQVLQDHLHTQGLEAPTQGDSWNH